MLASAGLDQQLELLQAVVQQLIATLSACHLLGAWGTQVQELQQRLNTLRAALASGDGGAGRLVIVTHLCTLPIYIVSSCNGWGHQLFSGKCE